jgi:hypothetical protein
MEERDAERKPSYETLSRVETRVMAACHTASPNLMTYFLIILKKKI